MSEYVQKFQLNRLPPAFGTNNSITFYTWPNVCEQEDGKFACWAYLPWSSCSTLLHISKSTVYAIFGPHMTHVDYLLHANGLYDFGDDICRAYGLQKRRKMIELGVFFRVAKQRFDWIEQTHVDQLIQDMEKLVPKNNIFCVTEIDPPVLENVEHQEQQQPPQEQQPLNWVEALSNQITANLQASIEEASSHIAHKARMKQYELSTEFEQDKKRLLEEKISTNLVQWIADTQETYKQRLKAQWRDQVRQELEDAEMEKVQVQVENKRKRMYEKLKQELQEYKKKAEFSISKDACVPKKRVRFSPPNGSEEPDIHIDLEQCQELAKNL